MVEEMPSSPEETPDLDLDQIIEILDPEIDVEAIMAQVRENVARRRAAGAYQEDLDAIADEVRAEVMVAQPAARSALSEEGGLATTLAELNARWVVREVPFTSRVPVLGPLIVAVRNFWNWMSTKWYVRGILQQLMGFNALVVRAFSEVNAEHQDLVRELSQVKAMCELQQKEIDLLKGQVERLQGLKSLPED